MKLEFCPKCGSKMEFLVKNREIHAVCPRCGYSEKVSIKHTYEKYKPETKVEVIEKEIIPMPVVSIECPKCGHHEAYAWTVQTRSSDESETQFFKCKKCGYVWRLYT